MDMRLPVGVLLLVSSWLSFVLFDTCNLQVILYEYSSARRKKRKWGSSKQWRSRRLERGMGKWLLLSLFLTIDATERRRPAPDAMNVAMVFVFCSSSVHDKRLS